MSDQRQGPDGTEWESVELSGYGDDVRHIIIRAVPPPRPGLRIVRPDDDGEQPAG